MFEILTNGKFFRRIQVGSDDSLGRDPDVWLSGQTQVLGLGHDRDGLLAGAAIVRRNWWRHINKETFTKLCIKKRIKIITLTFEKAVLVGKTKEFRALIFNSLKRWLTRTCVETLNVVLVGPLFYHGLSWKRFHFGCIGVMIPHIES